MIQQGSIVNVYFNLRALHNLKILIDVNPLSGYDYYVMEEVETGKQFIIRNFDSIEEI